MREALGWKLSFRFDFLGATRLRSCWVHVPAVAAI
jgi:hypothetical protein